MSQKNVLRINLTITVNRFGFLNLTLAIFFGGNQK